MPKVTPEHSDARRAQILDAATECFAREGFADTTMADLFAASGLSAGAVYHYFPSKRALLDAVFERHVAENQRENDQIADLNEARGALRAQLLASLRRLDEPDAEMRLPVMLHADVLRDAEIAERASRAQRDTVESFRQTVVRMQAAGLVDPDVDAEYLCWAAMGLFEGWRVMKLTDPRLSTERFARMVERLLADLVGPA